MARDYEKENDWQKSKYIEFRGKLNKKEYESVFDEIKSKIGISEFLRKAIELYKSDPKLFSEKTMM